MLSWGSIILLLLQIANKLYTSLQEKQTFDAAIDQAIAELNSEMFKKTQYAQKIMADINTKSDSNIDIILHDLEPKA